MAMAGADIGSKTAAGEVTAAVAAMRPITATLPAAVAAGEYEAAAVRYTGAAQYAPAVPVPVRVDLQREATALPVPALPVAAEEAVDDQVVVVVDGQAAVAVEGPADMTAAQTRSNP
jgi:hypothetical protein